MANVTGIGDQPVVASGEGSDDQKIWKRLTNLFDELTEIKVITVVENVSVRLVAKGNATKTEFEPTATPMTKAIVTIFDLIDGDVTNVIAPELKDDEAVRSFHAMQVEKSLAVLPDNLNGILRFGIDLIKEIRQAV